MFDKLEDLLLRYQEIENELMDPSVVNDQNRYRKLMKEQSDITDVVENIKNTRRLRLPLRIV